MPRKHNTPAGQPAMNPARNHVANPTPPVPELIPGLGPVVAHLRAGRQGPAPIYTGLTDQDDIGKFDIPGDEPLTDRTDLPVRRNSICEIRDALVRLRLHAMMSVAGLTAFAPVPGRIRLINVPRGADRPIVQAVLDEMLDESPKKTGVYSKHDGSTDYKKTEPFRSIRKDLLYGTGVIAIWSSAAELPHDLRTALYDEMTLPPLSGAMLSAILAFHFDVADPVDLGCSETQIGRLSDLDIAAIFCAPDLEDALRTLAGISFAAATGAGITLDDVHGQPEAVSALRQAVQDVQDFQAGRTPWSEVTKSFLLIGPPGTGKTMLAQALAGSAGISLVKTSYSDCQKEGHQGDMLKALASAVESAIANAPSGFFIDEIDSFFNRKSRMGSKDGYIIGVVNGLLTQLDRLSATPGVILIAATNYADRVDPAVIRAGRFDKHIRVGKPDRSGIRAMLAASLGAITVAEDLDALADQLLGLTGAEIAAMLRDARTRARAARSALAMTHVQAAADAIRQPIEREVLWRIAVHEAGHVLVGHLVGLPAATAARVASGDGYVTRPHPRLRMAETAHHLVCSHLAGRIAEETVFGAACDGSGNGPESDLAQATRVAIEAECALGFGDSLVWIDPGTAFHALPRSVQARVEARLTAAADRVHEMLNNHLADLQRIARVLLEQRELDADAITALMRDIPRSGDVAEIGKGKTHGF
jgi:cell division protease FtsH